MAAAGQIAATRHEEAEGHVDHLVARRVGRLHWLAGRLLADLNIAPPALFVLGVGILAYGWWPRFRLDEPRIADLRSRATEWYDELARLHRGARRR